ncbi:hypothetical protein BV25DRAFT_1921554 [Artomyces pyxidatus]|uniref:Uncharacterized protein n=1 Tax=Artomyces pyxidatus TaxID=48021 RepID=A0ACB8SIX2_9AGAM|nr:hypothetical protein BV25DRAFT_1921554 [Artomyces pyxidatus]
MHHPSPSRHNSPRSSSRSSSRSEPPYNGPPLGPLTDSWGYPVGPPPSVPASPERQRVPIPGHPGLWTYAADEPRSRSTAPAHHSGHRAVDPRPASAMAYTTPPVPVVYPVPHASTPPPRAHNPSPQPHHSPQPSRHHAHQVHRPSPLNPHAADCSRRDDSPQPSRTHRSARHPSPTPDGLLSPLSLGGVPTPYQEPTRERTPRSAAKMSASERYHQRVVSPSEKAYASSSSGPVGRDGVPIKVPRPRMAYNGTTPLTPVVVRKLIPPDDDESQYGGH